MFEVSFDIRAVFDFSRSIDAEVSRIDTGISAPAQYARYYCQSGISGLSSRLHGAGMHYNALHAWLPRRVMHRGYHLSNALFNMASAIECFTFAMNAIGNAKDATQFRDVTDENSLYLIGPDDIIGEHSRSGYAMHFPLLHALWKANAGLIYTVFEYHGVSKCREVQDNGAEPRTDPPAGFFDDMHEDERRHFTPYAQIILGPDIKKPRGTRSKMWQHERYATLEQVMIDYKPFIEESMHVALIDTTAL